jgi:hypothetical protein
MLVFFMVACTVEDKLQLDTPEKTIGQYFYALKTSNYDLAKSCFIAGKFLVPKELVKDEHHKIEIIDKYIIGEDKANHLYTNFTYENFGLKKGDVQIVVRRYLRANDYVFETIYFLKKIDDKWLIYSYASVDDD